MKDKKKVENIIAVILIIIFILILFTRFKPKTKKVPKPARLSQTAISYEKELVEYFERLGIPRNPFILGGKPIRWKTSEEKNGVLTLKAIVWDETNPLAIINDEIVGKDEEIDGFKVIVIEKEKVILEKGEEKIELEISLE